MHRWLNEPGVARWYGSAPSLDDVRAKYGRRIRGESPTRSLIAELDGRPIGHAQWYWTRDYPDYHLAVGADPGWVGVDYFLGDPADRGRGVGSAMIVAFIEQVVAELDGATAAVASPFPDNAPSIRALEKAGFGGGDIVMVGDDTEVVMVKALRLRSSP